MKNRIRKTAGRIMKRLQGGLAALALIGTASASSFDSVTVTDADADAGTLMGSVIGIMISITRYVGIALLIFGVFEIVMSFMQNQPEAKTKGIIMALAGVVMIGIKSILVGLGIIAA